MKFADDNPDNATLKIIFDDSKTSIGEINEAMKKSGFPVSGEPLPVP
ncbi:MAG: hypothetical protein ACYC69_13630 [Thermodesulfovibrionales bacterium]